MTEDALAWIQGWYLAQCDGDWEHQHGVEVGTLDNPGWLMKIDLTGTALQDRSFVTVAVERAPGDWLHCAVADGKFEAACGPLNLAEAIGCFRAWVHANAPGA